MYIDELTSVEQSSTAASGSELTQLADALNHGREVIRIWFCNRRQALKSSSSSTNGLASSGAASSSSPWSSSTSGAALNGLSRRPQLLTVRTITTSADLTDDIMDDDDDEWPCKELNRLEPDFSDRNRLIVTRYAFWFALISLCRKLMGNKSRCPDRCTCVHHASGNKNDHFESLLLFDSKYEEY